MTTSLHALIVEDYVGDSELILRELQKAEFDVTHERVENAGEMRSALQEKSWDIILCDFSLPDFDARIALALVREFGLDLPFIVISGTIGDETAIELMRTGAHDFLIKGHLTRLGAVVRRELEAARGRLEHRQAQNALRESENRFRSLADSGRALVWTSGTDRLCDYFNQPWLTLTGRTLEQEQGNGWTEGVHPDDRDNCYGTYVAAFEKREKISAVYRLRRHDGDYRWVLDEGTPRYDSEGNFIGYIGNCLDITEMKLAQDRLRQAARVFDNTRDGVAVADVEGKIVSVNRAFEQITGYCEAQVLGQSHRLLRSGRHDESFYRTLWASLLATGHWRGEIWNRRQNGEVYPEWISIDAVTNEMGTTTGYVSVFSDLSEIREARERLEFIVHHDPLTNLANRSLLHDRLQQAIKTAQYNHGRIAVLVLNIDRLGRINESLGHEAGDSLLAEMARRIQSVALPSDTVACMGGDKFVLMMTKFDLIEEVMATARRLMDEVAAPLQLTEQSLTVTASIGVSIFPDDGATASDLLRSADIALSQVKDAGRNGFRFFTAEMHARVLRWMSMENLLRSAIERNELLLLYQPQVSLSDGTICGMEALARWRSKELGLVSPADFIPIAEETGMIMEIGEWVLRSACTQNKAWQDAYGLQLTVAVNVSARQVAAGTLLETVQGILAETGLEPHYLELELTESVLMDGTDAILTQFAELRRLGVRFSLDDFGTGYSSLSYLSRFDLQKLKIDQGFVRHITTDSKSAAIAQATITLAHGLDISVVAEGVETESQLSHLRRAGCDEMQGYFFSRPVPFDELAAMISEDRKLALGNTALEGLRTLLLLDDEPHILSSLQRLLRREGYRILVANNASEAFELLALNEVQVIVSDQRMPDMSGTEFLSRVSKLYPNTVRMVLSGYTDLQSVTETVNRGAIYKFISKPWEDYNLRDEIRAAFQHSERGLARGH